jgi:hypothetical protein
MTLKVGRIVSHTGALQWGAGKVLEVTPTLAMIQFSDGKSRKISSSYFTTLQPADPGSFIPLPEAPLVVKAPRAPRVAKKKK